MMPAIVTAYRGGEDWALHVTFKINTTYNTFYVLYVSETG